MALNSSGPISLGGATTGQSVNLELGAGASSLISFNDANVRTLTNTTAGSTLIMPQNFWGTALGTSVRYLLVGGGGGGQSVTATTVGAGGGGGGGVASGIATLSGAITVTVGTGGSADAQGANTSISGSTITTVTAVGGGYGGSGNGGSGGGAYGGATASGGTGTAGQGNAGGASTATGSGGGGGGASAVGADGSSGGGGSGGAGTLSTISGAATYYGGGGGAGGGTLFYTLNNSLRLRSSASAYMARTPAVAGNRRTWTWSGWVKRGILGSTQVLFQSYSSNGNYFWFVFTGSDTLYIQQNPSNTIEITTTQVFRDTSSWYHVVLSVDTTQATAANRIKLYVNGSQVTALSTATYPSQNSDTFVNATVQHNIGTNVSTASYSNFLDAYLTEVNFIDGQALTPTSFGAFNSLTGVWGPAQYTGSYGTNGSCLQFSNTTSALSLGYDAVSATQITSGSGTYTIPSYTSSLVVELWGGGGGGAGTTNGSVSATAGTGGATTFGSLTANGGAGGTGAQDNVLNGTAGAGGTATGGDVNITGITGVTNYYTGAISGANAPNGGLGGLVNIASSTVGPGGGGGSGGNPSISGGGAGGSGGYVKKTYAAGAISGNISYSVGAGGTAGAGGTYSGNAGAAGAIRITVDGVRVDNDWNPRNISVTAGITYDPMTDVPTLTSATASNYAVLNPLQTGAYATVTNGGLTVTGNTATNSGVAMGSISVTTGKFYWEITQGTVQSETFGCAIYPVTNLDNLINGESSFCQAYGVGARASGDVFGISGMRQTATITSWTVGDVIGIAVDVTNGAVYYSKNGVWLNSGVPTSGASKTGSVLNWTPSASNLITPSCGAYNSGFINANFGQRPFSYTAPTGFVSLNVYNLPEPTVPAGNKYMDATLFTGTGSAQTIVNAAAFKPDFVWQKARAELAAHRLVDSVRGTSKVLYSNLTNAEATTSGVVNSFNTNGFTGGGGDVVTPGLTAVAWQWQAGQGSSSSNTNGTITSTVSVNASAGFSVVTYTGNGTNPGATIGHGLGVAPSFIVTKSRSGTGEWPSYHASVGVTNTLYLNATYASGTYLNRFSAVSSSTFTTGSNGGELNTNGVTYVAYCWAQIPGYSQFGSYIGSSNTGGSGSFVYTGFRPKYVMMKRSDGVGSWWIYDSVRSTYNASILYLIADNNAAEVSDATVGLDLLSNGFKLRVVGNYSPNTYGATFIYAAFAENPFKYSLAR